MSAILRIAIPAPLRSVFDYRPPPGLTPQQLQPGQRLRVPFGRKTAIGVLLGLDSHSQVAEQRLRHAQALLDKEALLPADILQLLQWASDYYHHPVGEVVSTALPVLLRQGRPTSAVQSNCWQLREAGNTCDPDELRRAPRQQALIQRLQQHPAGLSEEQLNAECPGWRDAMKRLQQKNLVTCRLVDSEDSTIPAATAVKPSHSPDQEQAITSMRKTLDHFQVHLLDGVTGSGKTEVYLSLIEDVIGRGQQVLLLLPEISLTPQTVRRLQQRLGTNVVALHSGLSDRQRLQGWLAARAARASVVIGTRSAVFTPMPKLGLIVVDEEHDASLKQHDGFRYHARDVALVRARNADIPVILGSATPSLESLHNALQGRYRHLTLSQRVGGAVSPPIRLLDIRQVPVEEGLSAPLLSKIHQHLDADGQVLLFLNRRGFAPTLMCPACGWIAGCHRCDARMTLHSPRQQLICHHCGYSRARDSHCPECGEALLALGEGTQRIEEVLSQHFPEAGLVRIDRDSTRRKGALEASLDGIRQGDYRLLIGTQMLAKGHHFPNVTLVGIVDVDQSLFSADFRASERLAQLILQVAGRAGRAERPGEVVLQTRFPDHPLLNLLVSQGYPAFARAALEERQLADFPPFNHLALLRSESVAPEAAQAFLQECRRLAQASPANQVEITGPVPAPMERRAGRYRAQLLLFARQRAPLHGLLNEILPRLDKLPQARKVRWSLDVDPIDTY
jgi:primosomal protein N' (replication factor Y)